MKSKKNVASIPEDISIADDELPEGWEIKKIKEITEKVPSIKPESEPERIFGYVDIGSINNETNRIFDFKKIRGEHAPSRARQSIQPNDVLFSNVRTYLRNIAIIPNDLAVNVCSTGFTVLRSNGSIEPKFLFYYTLTDGFINQVTPQQTGSQYPATTDRVVKGATISFPRLAEQQRIVARVEALLSHINAARDRVSRVPLIMKKFRQAVLAAACEGRLTEQSDGYDVRLAGDLFTDARYGTSNKCDYSSENKIPVLRIPNIATGKLELTDLKYGDLTENEIKKLAVQRGDLIICRTNGSLDLVGKAAIIPDLPEQFVFASYLIRVRVNRDLLLPEYYHICLTGQIGREHIEETSRGTAGQFNLNLEILRTMPIPLPSLTEQHEIVRRVNALFERADQIEQQVVAATKRTEALTQAVLGKAFMGKL